MKVLLVCLLALVASQEAFGTDCDKYREEGFGAIRDAQRVASGTIGVKGSTPPASHEFRCIVHEPDARQIFAHLVDHARRPGKMYGLAGLYIVDRPLFDQLILRFEQDWTRIEYIDGCNIRIKSIAEFTNVLKDGRYPSSLAGRDVRPDSERKTSL